MQKIVAGAAIAVALCYSGVGQAASPASPACSALLQKGCACAVALPASGPIAQLREISGNVAVTRDVTYSPVRDPTRVGLNDQVSVGRGGQALLSLAGQCQLKLAGPQKVVLKLEGGCACVARLPTEAAANVITSGSSGFDLAAPATGGGGGNNPTQTAALGSGLLIGGIAAAALASGQSSFGPDASGGGMVAALDNSESLDDTHGHGHCDEVQREIAALATELNEGLRGISKDVWGTNLKAHRVKCPISGQ